MGPAEYYKKIAAVPDGPWVVKITNSAEAINKFHRAFSITWFVIGLKGYFIQQDLHTLGALQSPLKLIREIDINPTDLEFFF